MKALPFTLLLGILLSSLVACNPEDSPLGSLSSSTLSQRYDENYWMTQQEKNTALWHQAVKLCQPLGKDSGSPNCGSVMELRFISNGPVAIPQYGTGQGFGANSIPRFPPAKTSGS